MSNKKRDCDMTSAAISNKFFLTNTKEAIMPTNTKEANNVFTI
jgi:hypothetical protein